MCDTISITPGSLLDERFDVAKKYISDVKKSKYCSISFYKKKQKQKQTQQNIVPFTTCILYISFHVFIQRCVY